jgi:hypothetical protein
VNDGAEQADRLAAIARRLRAHVNVIPMNPTPGVRWREPSAAATRAFVERVRGRGAEVTLRDTRGRDADAACGQLLASYTLGAGTRLPAAVGAADRVERLRGVRRDRAAGRAPRGDRVDRPAGARRRRAHPGSSRWSASPPAATPARWQRTGRRVRGDPGRARRRPGRGVAAGGRAPDLEVLDGPGRGVALAVVPGGPRRQRHHRSGGAGPTLAALEAGTPVALANKESLIVGGDLVVAAAEAAGGRDSHADAGRLGALGARPVPAGGAARRGRAAGAHRQRWPLPGPSAEELAEVTATDALAHPTWEMGPVVTVNSATLMNKGLELIEAHELFDVDWDALDVVVHPQSIVHSMVEFVDGSTLAQLSPPDMRLPIQLALAWPQRLPTPSPSVTGRGPPR